MYNPCMFNICIIILKQKVYKTDWALITKTIRKLKINKSH